MSKSIRMSDAKLTHPHPFRPFRTPPKALQLQPSTRLTRIALSVLIAFLVDMTNHTPLPLPRVHSSHHTHYTCTRQHNTARTDATRDHVHRRQDERNNLDWKLISIDEIGR